MHVDAPLKGTNVPSLREHAADNDTSPLEETEEEEEPQPLSPLICDDCGNGTHLRHALVRQLNCAVEGWICTACVPNVMRERGWRLLESLEVSCACRACGNRAPSGPCAAYGEFPNPVLRRVCNDCAKRRIGRGWQAAATVSVAR